MKKWIVLAGLAATLAAAGVSAAYLQNRGSEPAPAAALAPIAAVTEIAPGTGQPRPGGCSCCSAGSPAAAQDTGRREQLSAYLTDFYTRILGEGVTVEIQDFGCHQEASILHGGRVVKRLSIRGNTVSDIT